MPSLWNDGVSSYSWRGETVIPEYIRFRPGADKSVVNARIDAMIEKYRPEEDKKKYGYTAFVKPIRDTYRNYESVERMRNIMTVLGPCHSFHCGAELRADFHFLTYIPCQSGRRA